MKNLPPTQAFARFALVVLAGLLLGGCDEEPIACPKDLPPTTCPSPAPTYSANVAPVLRSRCARCHGPGGISEFLPFQTYDQVQMETARIEVQLASCIMPPADQPQLTSGQWRGILGWIACGAMNN